MLGYISHIYFSKFNIRYQGKERPAKTKLMPAILYTGLAACVGKFLIFENILKNLHMDP